MILSDEPILYPYVTQPDVLVVMSQEAYTRLAEELGKRMVLNVVMVGFFAAVTGLLDPGRTCSTSRWRPRNRNTRRLHWKRNSEIPGRDRRING